MEFHFQAVHDRIHAELRTGPMSPHRRAPCPCWRGHVLSQPTLQRWLGTAPDSAAPRVTGVYRIGATSSRGVSHTRKRAFRSRIRRRPQRENLLLAGPFKACAATAGLAGSRSSDRPVAPGTPDNLALQARAGRSRSSTGLFPCCWHKAKNARGPGTLSPLIWTCRAAEVHKDRTSHVIAPKFPPARLIFLPSQATIAGATWRE